MGNTPKPPRPQGAPGRSLWRRLQAAYRIQDAGGLEFPMTACECLDLETRLLAEVERDGFFTVDRYQQRRPHPALSAARDARAQRLQALRGLNLAIGEPAAPGRPEGT